MLHNNQDYDADDYFGEGPGFADDPAGGSTRLVAGVVVLVIVAAITLLVGFAAGHAAGWW